MSGNRRVRMLAAAASGFSAVSLMSAGSMVSDVALPSARAVVAPVTRQPASTVAARKKVVRVQRHGRRVYPRFEVKAVAGGTPFEVWAERVSYHDPIVARRVIRHGLRKRRRRLPDGSVRRWRGLEDFTRLVVRKPGGRKMVDRTLTFCPLSGRRTRASAPAAPYPKRCGGMRWTLGMVWGVQAGWQAPLVDTVGLRLPVGRYRARVMITRPYRSALRIRARKAAVTVKLVVRRRQRAGTSEITGSHCGPAGPAARR
jgi:hypothetical protein